MLVLTRRVSERIQIGEDVVLTIVRIDGNKVRIGIEAPEHVKVKRDELAPKTDLATERNFALAAHS